ncbi:type VI secretion system-associated protein TagF [Falsiroseomonas sp. HW251]|uniref:type VI secretion system-associated protein TagF n=1 Tax=Falsiroseomonas sp. HW251 TaxID=3390998 RepID=UPI003D31F6CB
MQARLGFSGKLPARGDFVARGLPRSFAEPWDAWLAEVMTGSRVILGESWLPAWLEAPIWRFALPAGFCGPDAVTGVMLPSVDRAGRHWPLTLAAVLPGLPGAPLPDAAWLDALEQAGLDAVMADATPERIEEALAAAPPAVVAGGEAAWWTDGAPRVQPRRVALGALPGAQAFAGMLDDAAGALGETVGLAP